MHDERHPGESRRRAAETQLLREHDLVAQIMETSPVGITVVDRHGQIIFANANAENMLGLTRDEITQRTYNDPAWRITDYAGQPFPDEQLPFRRVIASGQPVSGVRHAIQFPDGRRTLLLINAAPLFDDSGLVDGMVATVEDVTEQVRAESALRESELLLRTAMESLPFDFFALDCEGRYVLQNSTCRAHWGDIIGKRPQDLQVDRQTQALWESNNRRALAGEVVTAEVTFPVHNETRHFHNIVSPIRDGERILGILGINIDITDRRLAQRAKAQIERQLLQAQKMEAVGALAGGLAHDFNNLLTGILGRAEQLRRDAAPGSTMRRSAEVIEVAALRATEITRQLLGYAREGKVSNVPVAVRHLVEEVVSILEHTLDKRIQIVTRFGIEQPVVDGDPGQLEQVLMNLAVNARDAMPDGGRLLIEVATAPPAPVRTAGDEEGGPYLLITVSDTGCGIDKAIRERIFEPFFTTKEQGQGTGMGLAMAYGIVDNHGGWIEVESEPGHGSRFSVFLPLSEGPEPRSTESLPATFPRQEGAGILVVDDDEIVLETVAGMLTELGYRVRCATNGQDGVATYHSHMEEIDLVLIDLIMPAMDGTACVHALREINPQVRVLIVTGHTVDDVAAELAVHGRCQILTKPFLRATLARAVAKALAASR